MEDTERIMKEKGNFNSRDILLGIESGVEIIKILLESEEIPKEDYNVIVALIKAFRECFPPITYDVVLFRLGMAYQKWREQKQKGGYHE